MQCKVAQRYALLGVPSFQGFLLLLPIVKGAIQCTAAHFNALPHRRRRDGYEDDDDDDTGDETKGNDDDVDKVDDDYQALNYQSIKMESILVGRGSNHFSD